jgi:RNA 3'-terminal phosphate cyclase
LQTILPALLTAAGPSAVEVEGGTDNPFAPPFDALARSFLPLLERMGPRIDASVPVGEHLADQLLLPLALAGGGSFLTVPLSRHATTNALVLQAFLDVEVRASVVGPAACRVAVEVR